jgi:hypothetical protein
MDRAHFIDRSRFMDRARFDFVWIEAILPAAMDRGHFDLLWIEAILIFMSAPILPAGCARPPVRLTAR